MAAPSVIVNTDAFNDAVARYLANFKKTLPEAFEVQFRRLMTRVIQFTPPKTRAQGRKAVARDIVRAIQPLKPGNFDDPGIRKMIRARDYDGLNAALRARPGYIAEVVPFSKEIHQKARNKRGRVRPTGYVTPDADKVAAYIRETQENVGRGRGGWARALVETGGKPSEWFGRWARTGTFEDRLKQPDPSARATNKSEWADQGDEDRTIANAVEARARDIVADIQRRLATVKK